MQESILFVCFHVEKRDWLSGFFFHRTVARSRLRHAVIAVKPHEAAAISLSGLTSCCRVRCSLSGGVWSPVRSMRWEPGVPSAPRSRPGSGSGGDLLLPLWGDCLWHWQRHLRQPVSTHRRHQHQKHAHCSRSQRPLQRGYSSRRCFCVRNRTNEWQLIDSNYC